MTKRLLPLATLVVAGLLFVHQSARAEVRSIVFPVIGSVSYHDDFGDPRSGHTHQGNDIFGKKMQPLVAAVTGRVRWLTWPEASYGYMVSLTDNDGYEYWYLHINNDHPGTDDGLGGGRNAFAPSVDIGYPVVKGQLIGYMGDSGNAESTSPHLHFEIHRPDDKTIDPFPTLQAAQPIARAVITPVLTNELLPYAEFKGGANVATGELRTDLDGNEIVTGAGPGGGPRVQIFDQDHNPAGGFYAYDQSFHGGVDVAVGDINGDGQTEIVTAPGPGLRPEIRVFTTHGDLLAQFLAYKSTFLGGVRVAAGDMDGDGNDEIITGVATQGRPDVRIYEMTGERLHEFMAYSTLFIGGVDVAAISATETQPGIIVTAPNRGGGPDIYLYNSVGQLQGSFFAYTSGFRGGVRVSTRTDVSAGQTQILTVPATGGGAQIRWFDTSGTVIGSRFEFERWWSGGFDVAGDANQLMMSTGPGGRRASIMFINQPVIEPVIPETPGYWVPPDVTPTS